MHNRNMNYMNPRIVEGIANRVAAEKRFAELVDKRGKLLVTDDGGFPDMEPAFIDLKIAGTYERMTVEYWDYQMNKVFQGAGVYERQFDYQRIILQGCKVRIVGKRVYVTTGNGKTFYKISTNPKLRIYRDRGFQPVIVS